jgi:hexosaminidase
VNGKNRFSIIPQPKTLKPGTGVFHLTPQTKLFYTPQTESVVGFFENLFRNRFSPLPKQKWAGSVLPHNAILFRLDSEKKSLGNEGYRLEVTPNGILLEAVTPAGLFYAVQTLRQLLPPEFEEGHTPASQTWDVPAVSIEDSPDFPWRGLLLDCCRHFMSVEFVKQTIDRLAFYKLNRFHWHLTEDQGWRIEIKKYPRLTEIGAWRTEPDGTRHGGFYTQEEIRDVVAYAQERFVTVVPEIEMPGHSRAALAAYPELSCTGGPFEVANQWSVFKDVYCAGKEKTFAFLEDVLTEVMELFPSRYIHIGGDEVPKHRWKECPDCQARMRREGLKNEEELQSYFIKRIEKFLNAHGRQIIGWDEILQGGLAPGATVQSWRGVEGGIAAARAGHDVVMSPHTHVYFDHPARFKGLRRVYAFHPIPEELSPTEARHVLGSECCMWTEYAPQEVVNTRIFPRLLAFSETVWNGEEKDFPAFWERTAEHYRRLRAAGVTLGSEGRPFELQVNFVPEDRVFEVALESLETGPEFFLTRDGRTPTPESECYTGPFRVEQPVLLKIQAFWKNRPYGECVEQPLILHKAVGKSLQIAGAPDELEQEEIGYLTDGLLGSLETHDGLWYSHKRSDLEVEIPLGKAELVSNMAIRFIQNTSRRAFLPVRVLFFVRVEENPFELVGSQTHKVPVLERGPLIREFRAEFPERRVTAVKIVAESLGVCPSGHPGEGEDAWLLADEIVVE